uniref:NADH:ubiquinone reductase (H(+)-translocating) n=1 Tax=Haplorchis taichui TaxID=235153 RepID=U3MFN1_9TREM|nr:NADH dehydrogenase subunit 5 [Haplorchis taichui]AGW07008.1 NADH dehydrogenase subunit 5 [Haplorchis taichui]
MLSAVVVLFVAVMLFLLSILGYWGWGWSFSWLGFVFRDYDFVFVVSDVSLVCEVMLLFCGSVALFYCFHYFGQGADAFFLYPLMAWFLGVMSILVMSGSVLLSLLMWEYLGLVSFFLILFYSNMASLRASLITLFVSRFGDAALFMVVMWVSWWFGASSILLGLLLFFIVLTKSACYPFISWLLEAMRAPTPVSSLVHSSTLVAAGVWYLFCYGDMFSYGMLSVLFMLSLVTVLVSGFCALVFNDLKKLVALSTCNNVSWCILFYVCGSLDLALLQLITHGVCKCYLFMSIGDLMGLSGGSQSSVGVYLSRYVGRFSVYLQSILVISLSGLPFLGVFFSKHMLVGSVCYVYGWGYFGLMFLGFFLSYAYCVRLVLLLVKGLGGLSSGYSSSFIIISGLSVAGTLLNSCGMGVLEESAGLLVSYSFFVGMIQVLGCLGGFLFFVAGGEGVLFGPSTLSYSDSVVSGVYDFYLRLSAPAVVSFYRWEYYVFSLWPRLTSRFLLFRLSAFSFNSLVLFLLCFLFLYFLVGV